NLSGMRDRLRARRRDAGMRGSLADGAPTATGEWPPKREHRLLAAGVRGALRAPARARVQQATRTNGGQHGSLLWSRGRGYERTDDTGRRLGAGRCRPRRTPVPRLRALPFDGAEPRSHNMRRRARRGRTEKSYSLAPAECGARLTLSAA